MNIEFQGCQNHIQRKSSETYQVRFPAEELIKKKLTYNHQFCMLHRALNSIKIVCGTYPFAAEKQQQHTQKTHVSS